MQALGRTRQPGSERVGVNCLENMILMANIQITHVFTCKINALVYSILALWESISQEKIYAIII